ncbi:hypothetical protein QLX08_006236 [Tetragonisca angustula]|uniref:Uncharacterized protein n=1 Tax=Tetragonisca angustula TaxID=166442 RepID=A0AAW0ZUL2_9HYME
MTVDVADGAGTGISIVQGSGRTSYGLLRRRTISNKQTNEWEAKEVADIKVFVTELASYYSELSEEVSSSGRTNSITSSLPSTTIRSLLSNRGSSLLDHYLSLDCLWDDATSVTGR